MHRIDSPGATVDNLFTDGNPVTATPATVVWAKWLNNLQEEIMKVIFEGGITPSSASNHDLFDAIMALIAAEVPDVPDASTTVKGKIEIATNTEATTGTDTERAVTPAGVKAHIDARIASETARGIIEIATNAETQAGTDTERAVTPAALASLTATLTRLGIIELATSAEAIAGVDAVRAITPATLYDVLALFDPVPIGVIDDYGGTADTIPPKYLMPYGQAISRTTYATLFARYGTTYGAGDGSTTFNLPDVRGRVIAGLDNMGGTTAGRITNAIAGIVGTTLGAFGGAQGNVMTVAQMPNHRHFVINANNGPLSGDPTTTNQVNRSGTGAAGQTSNYFLTASDVEATVGRSSATGGGTAFPVVQPTIMMNKICKVL